ncbi:hypothetical protein HYALB_00011954 [Hymenoscyphus albidus]|uniref:AMP-dependent synthetase/ligase domain-containing protein n=1 Tax=Hymenoscyphus albidus TaxID=595503 RepID=A0A9N9Q9W7_9HELO|nr:hypothetical protein HYALB_00011954 [Hymenoscyphus albidus]
MGDSNILLDAKITPIPVLVDEKASNTPDRTFAIIPKTANINDGFRDYKYSELAQAGNKMSWWLEKELEKSVIPETLAYMGAPDLRYTFLYLATQKTRRPLLFPLNQNSRAGHLGILTAIGCKTLLASQDQIELWNALHPEIDTFKVLVVPELEYFLKVEETKEYPYNFSWQDVKDDVGIILHTSGSTGLPKPIKYTNHMLSIFATDSGDLATMFEGLRTFVPLPPSWGLGVAFHMIMSIQFGTIPISLPTDSPQPLTAEYVDKVHTSVQAEAGVYIPYVLEQLSKTPEYLEHMKGLKYIGYGGAPLSREIGDIFAKFTHVQPIMGSTEAGSWGLRKSDPKDWIYYDFDPSSGFQFHKFQDDLYESVIVKHKDPEMAKRQLVFYVFPDLEEFHTKDIWKEHETKKGLWQYAGRMDDFVKLSSLTKFNATHVEGLILKDPRVTGAIMGGDGQMRPFLLLELADNSAHETIDSLWPTIEAANDSLSAEIQLQKNMVLLTKEGKRMKRGFKGLPKRRETLLDYAKEIENLY